MNRSITAAALGAGILLLGGCNTGSTVIPVAHVQEVYVAVGGPAIEVFPLNASGGATPTRTITGAATGLTNPFRIAFDQSGDLFVANSGAAGSIVEYAPGANGNVAPIKTITYSGFSNPAGVAVDTAGNVYVSDTGALAVFIFSASQSGAVTPTAVIKGSNTTLNFPGGIQVDPAGKVYVSDDNTGAVLEWNAGHTGNVTPDNIIAPINDPYGMQLVNGKLYIGSQTSQVYVFPASATGAAVPVQLISGGLTTLTNQDRAAAADAAGNIYVANGNVLKFSAGSTGNVPPTATLTVPTDAEGIAVF
jgi:hypothetical protein